MDDVSATISNESVPVRGRPRRSAAVVLLVVAWLVIGAVLVGSMVRIERWELAPGEAMQVAPRIEFVPTAGSVPERYPASNRIRFVTAFTGQLTALDSFIGWLDPDVQVDTHDAHFGKSDPSAVRVIGFQSMYSAQQLAMYVALTHLGIGDPSFIEGAPVVAQLVCLDRPTDDSACKRLDVGDTVMAVEGSATPTPSSLKSALAGARAGDTLTITVKPYGSDATKDKSVRLIESPNEPGRVLLGVVLADTRKVSLPFDLKIATGGIGGPSAGLAFTLALIDELTPGSLLGEARVAATGTIDENGEVGAIGALPQKAVAVRQAGATVFLVPKGQDATEVASAVAATDGKVRIIQVATLGEALGVLHDLGGDPVPTTE